MIRFLAALLLGAMAGNGTLAEPRAKRGGEPGFFDFYVVSLSWSATYCEEQGNARNARQCEIGRNPGFVLHGLWPQFERGYPVFCGPDNRNPTRQALERADGVYPDFGLARHEWSKHGTCSGESPAGYFDASALAKAKIKIPPALVAPARDLRLSPMEIERAFAETNPGLRTDMMAVTCARGGKLKEVRICLSRDLRNFRPCEEVDRDSCRSGDIAVPAAR